ncbi:MAG: ribonuclease HI family protein [Candidatus Lokiarchaeota archaeon]|nr:ribonuclease HI family protein [Candidatus Lokiarchaeota archaeon]
MKGNILKIYTDGAARGNPGPAAYAFIFVDDDDIIHKGSGFLGSSTNNAAEYKAIINALKAVEKFHRGRLQIYSDSNLAVQQINKKWRINYPHLSELCNEVYQLCEKYEKVEFFHVSRKNPFIQKCDELCNSQLDKEGFN